jgi:hypothetical protein
MGFRRHRRRQRLALVPVRYQDDHWSNDQLRALATLRGSDFEAVDEAGLMLAPGSAAVRG